ncbi:HSP20-like chaperone [Boletus coccyginus]|nr:HSP20-like chaperone [Boletus coccyginus]
MSTHPEVLWAQRSSSTVPEKNVIYLTVNLPNIIESSLEYALTSTSISFKATTAGQTDYAFNLDFFAEVDAEKSTSRVTSRSFVAVLRKKESQSEYWPRLTKEKVKTPFIKTDFGKWIDEDEQDGNPNADDDFGPGGMGMPGMDGSDFDLSKVSISSFGGDFGAGTPDVKGDAAADSDSDDGGPPPLEDVEPAK